jgi:phosphoribosylanthranilate isomerase
MTWVKICGITNLEDALAAVNAGADALGFVFYEKSPRNVGPDTVREIVKKLPAHVEKIAVIVGSYPDNFAQLVNELGITGVQFHLQPQSEPQSQDKLRATAGGLPPDFKFYLSLPAEWFIEQEDRARNFMQSIVDARLAMQKFEATGETPRILNTVFLDSGSLQQPGGTGKVFNWEKALRIVGELKQTVNVVVAGGLNPGNVNEAIRVLGPWGVDVSTGVEAQPGKKDPQKVRAFIEAARSRANHN